MTCQVCVSSPATRWSEELTLCVDCRGAWLNSPQFRDWYAGFGNRVELSREWVASRKRDIRAWGGEGVA